MSGDPRQAVTVMTYVQTWQQKMVVNREWRKTERQPASVRTGCGGLHEGYAGLPGTVARVLKRLPWDVAKINNDEPRPLAHGEAHLKG